ncbi:M48 family metallopeptidase [Luteimonas aestuarii]|uniref:M48 family metallopeptidase n=1 Tax=Luteimonas aestuarii TaxID=453837 RepID=A0A4R5U4M2_9GAMM|nr:M48 family metallopeptidase [Luteimonas aestuarii]TDK28614.1 M48 family metallopeptidase [Luteimonas aestuarii]
MEPPTLEGDWYDGTTSRPRRAMVSREAGDRLRIASADEAREVALRDVRLSARLGATPRVLSLPDGSRVECHDSPLLDRWFPRPDSRIDAWADWLERRRLAIAVAALVTTGTVVAFFQFGVPRAAAYIAGQLPRGVEVAASHQAMQVLGRLGLRETTLPAARREALEARFLAMVDGEPRHSQMQLAFADAPRFGPNAFALPDGRLFATDQLVELAGDDDEILAVLAHEAGHHVHRHGMRQAIESSSVVVVVGLIMGDATGSSVVAALPAVLLSSGYSRGHEREADAYALDLLERRGLDPQAFGRIMQRLGEAHGAGDSEVAGWLSTHPPTPERIRAAMRHRGAGPERDLPQDAR